MWGLCPHEQRVDLVAAPASAYRPNVDTVNCHFSTDNGYFPQVFGEQTAEGVYFFVL